MSAAGLHASADIIALLSAGGTGWNSANTDNVTPLFIEKLETPWESLDFGAKPIIYVKLLTSPIQVGMYGLEFYHRPLVSMEILSAAQGSTKGGRAHFVKLVDEAVRVINANVRQAGYAYTVPREIQEPRFDKERRIYTCAVILELYKVRTS